MPTPTPAPKVPLAPRVEDLERLPTPTLEGMAAFAELVLAKPYVLDRIRTVLALRG